MSIVGNLSNACTMHDKGSHNTAVKYCELKFCEILIVITNKKDVGW